MFSAAIEVVLTIAYREAVSRRHAYVTLEHLLYALAHDNDGERILAACGADLPRLRRDLDAYLRESLEQTKRGEAREPACRAIDGGLPVGFGLTGLGHRWRPLQGGLTCHRDAMSTHHLPETHHGAISTSPHGRTEDAPAR